MYEHKHPLFAFPKIPNFEEVPIDTTGRNYDDVAKEIRERAGPRSLA
jgi:hypothetical protein